MFNFDTDHKSLVRTLFIVFFVLSIGIAIVPAFQMQKGLQPLPAEKPMTLEQREGLNLYISEGCVACHTQQVRNIAMDETWGSRPSIPSDYYYSKQRQDLWRQTPSILGSERTGPDLTNVGVRQPSLEWHLLHLYNPRSVVEASVMPAYPWLFETVDSAKENDVVVNVPEEFMKDASKKIIAKEKALKLVAYLLALKQADLEGPPSFIPAKAKKKKNSASETGGAVPKIDGGALYATNCAACHQTKGTGLKGAFPPLAGSPIVTDDDPTKMIEIILLGYDARPEYATMAAFKDQLTDEEIAAISTHERSSWGNKGSEVTPEQVQEIRGSLKELIQ